MIRQRVGLAAALALFRLEKFVERVKQGFPAQLAAAMMDRDFDREIKRPAPLVGKEWAREQFQHVPRRSPDLGKAERDAEWISDLTGARWRWTSRGWWWSRNGDFYNPAELTYVGPERGPFTEIVSVEMDWLGWAVPAILTELDLHFYTPDRMGSGVRCQCEYHATSLADWADHVAPLIAKRIGCDPKRAAQALSRYVPDRV